MIIKLLEALRSVNYTFDKNFKVIKKAISLKDLNEELISKAKIYIEEINKLQKLHSTKRKKILIDYPEYELVACCIGVKGKKYSSFGSSYKILKNHEYRKLIKELLVMKLGEIGTKVGCSSNIIGKCAEVKAFNTLIKRESKTGVNDVEFTKAIRPRTLEEMERCCNCKTIFGDESK